ncbi:MAG: DUF1648 domain-containing protein [Salinibacterium sp.]|nr:DUF1648 domain-containing protein [Salinibacterium sp.]MBF0672349.1 DUF1648 domain-containing protein [Salinibacterium sp.]
MTETTADVTARASSTRSRAITVGAIVPIVVTALAAVITASWIPELPSPVAVHWAGDTPDGYGNVWLFILMPLVICTLFALFVVAMSSRPTESGLLTANQKFVLVTSPWMAGLLSVGLGGTLWVQRGLDDAAEASGGAIWMLWGLLAGFAMAIPAWFLLPPSDRAVVTGEPPAAMDFAPTELVSWSRSAKVGRGARAVIASVFVMQFVLAFVLAANGEPAWTVLLVVVAVLLVLVAATFYWRVTVDRRGLTVRSALSWPKTTIPADEITDVAVVDVQPVAEFGGWGWRWGADGRTGVVLRTGEGIQVTRANGKRFVVTVDDASTGAAVLAGVRSGG